MGRISGMISTSGLWSKLNLFSKLYPQRTPLASLTHWALPGGSGAWENYTFQQIISQTFTPANVGDSFGPTWTTHWFRIHVEVPDSWAGKEVHIRWASGSEAAIYDTQGNMLQGLSPSFREEFILSRSWDITTGPLDYYVEMACNDMFGAGDGDQIAPTRNDKYFQLSRAEIGVFDRLIYKVHTDLDMLYGIAEQMPNDIRGYQAMFCANEMVTLIQRDNNLEKASEIADAFFAEGNGQKQFTLVSMGHCHIDTAWLWPYEETKRKVARSWISQIGLMREYPDYVFTASSAQQFEWLKEDYPDVYQQVKQYVAQGRFVPVGATWLEMDGNIPNGESFIRQFFYGQRFFQQEFNYLCKEFWLPDTFGYSAQIPQILNHMGIQRFLTQKMSWNLVNKFPTHNFWWEGIDGSQVLVHFPPGDSYNMNATVSEILYSVSNNQDKGRTNQGIYLYGVGDGGGGPHRLMIERQKRLQNVDGVPKIVFEGPDYFFQQLEKDGGKLVKWVGELYLELHNGTYTSQAKIKWFNRKSEFFLREVEHLMTIAVVTGKVTSAQFATDLERVDRCWKNVLLNQFHDILPGSSVNIANQRAWEVYAVVFTELLALRSSYNQLILGTGTTDKAIFNTLPWDVRTVVFMKPDSGNPSTGTNIQQVDLQTTSIEDQGEGRYRVPSTFAAALVNLTASGYSLFTPLAPTNPVVYTAGTGSVAQYSNGLVRLEVQKTGRPYEEIYYTGASGIERKVFNDRLNTGIRGGQFYIYNDVPLYWDAWDVMDYHLETRRDLDYSASSQFQNIASGPIVGVSKFTGTFGNGSTLEKYTIMRADTAMIEYYVIVDWKEDHKFLKIEFPVDVLTREATYEIQFGHLKRPNHINTSWEMAKFEVCGHKWADVSQTDRGVTFITDSKYGWHVRDNIVKMSLLKAAKNPDENADMHKHFIYFAVLPHEGSFQEADIIRRAYELNVLGSNNIPLLGTSLAGTELPNNYARSGNRAVVISALKVAHDDPRKVIVRAYEAHGGAATTTITIGFAITKVERTDGLEVASEEIPSSNNSFTATFRPFEIRTFAVSF